MLGNQRNTYAFGVRSNHITSPPALTAICVNLVICVNAIMDVGAGTLLALTVCGRKISFVVLEEAEVLVKVKLFAFLSGYAEGISPGTQFEVELSESASLRDLLKHLGIPSDEAQVTFVNGIIQSLEFCLQAGDEIGIFPPIAGG